MSKSKRVAVIGAGISGLTMAYRLKQNGYDVTVFEKSGHIGGSIITEKTDGYLIDLGPNSTLETSDELKQLVDELGLTDEKVYGNKESNNRYVLKGGKLHPIPMSLQKFLKTDLFSWKAKLRLLKEPFIKPTSGDDITLADFVRYRLGEEFLDYAINPFVAGVYAGSPESLSTAAGFPKLYALEQKYGSFIKGTIKGARERKKRNEVAKDRAKLFTFKNGMQTFTDALAKQLDGQIISGAEVRSLTRSDQGFHIEYNGPSGLNTKTFDQAVLSVPADALALILNKLTSNHAKTIGEIKYPPVAVVFMGFKETDVERKLDGFGFLIPEKEKRQILGSIWSSTIFPGRAPQGHAAFTTFVGGTRQPQNAGLDDAALSQLVFDELNDIIGLKGQPVFTRMMRWPRAIPQYTLGYKKVQQIFNDLESEFPGLYFAGNFRRGISVGDSVLCAHETVQKMTCV